MLFATTESIETSPMSKPTTSYFTILVVPHPSDNDWTSFAASGGTPSEEQGPWASKYPAMDLPECILARLRTMIPRLCPLRYSLFELEDCLEIWNTGRQKR